MLSGSKLQDYSPNVGVYVWGYRLNTSDFLYTVTKTLEPTKMLIRNNKDNRSSKRFYNSNENHAVCVSKSDKVLKSKVYALTREGLNCFTTKEECVKHFKQKILDVIKDIENAKQERIDFFDNNIKRLYKYENYDFW